MTGTLPTTNPNVYTDHYRFQVSLTADPAGRSPSTHATVTGTARGAVGWQRGHDGRYNRHNYSLWLLRSTP
jgi:hypothetical protein